jgi:hypothetical protein
MSNKTTDDRLTTLLWVLLVLVLYVIPANLLRNAIANAEREPVCYTDTQCGCTLYCLEPSE